MRLYTTVFSIVHLIRCQQKGSDRLLLAKSMEKTLIRKILKSALHQKEPQFHCKLQTIKSFAVFFTQNSSEYLYNFSARPDATFRS